MEFKDLDEAKKYVELLIKDKEELTKKVDELNKSATEKDNKNNELIKTNSQLMGDLVNMKSKSMQSNLTDNPNTNPKDEYDGLFLHDLEKENKNE